MEQWLLGDNLIFSSYQIDNPKEVHQMSNLNYIFRFRILEKNCSRCTTEVLGYSNIYAQKLFHKSWGDL